PRPDRRERRWAVWWSAGSSGSLRRAEVASGLETGPGAGVARGSDLVDLDEQRITVAVEADALDVLSMAGRVALAPVLSAGAGPEGHAAAGEGATQRLVVHPGEHEHLAGVVLLDDC